MRYPADRLEVLVVDGMSEDRTREIVADYARRHPHLRLLDNPKRILASAWNVGIRNARGDIIVALHAHTVFDADYIATCVKYIAAYPEAGYVGGIVRTLPQDDTTIGRALALALSHPFGVGGSRFRTGASKPTWSDTAAFGGYRRALFDEIGLFNEELARSQDMELHLRLKKAGKRTLLVPEMVGQYYARTRLPRFLRDCYVNGFWLTYPLRFSPHMVSARHLVPMAFVTALSASLIAAIASPAARWIAAAIGGAYLAANLTASVAAAVSKRSAVYALLMPFVFASLHVLYGIGSIVGLVKAMTSRRFWHQMRRGEVVPAGRAG